MFDDSNAAAIRDLADLIERYAGEDGMHATAIPRLFLIRSSSPTQPIHPLHEPAVCLIAQGRKQVMVGQSVHVYDPAKYLVVSVDVPIVGQILEASSDAPYLCLRFDLDPAAIGALLLEAKVPGSDNDAPGPALSLSAVTAELLDAAIRMLRLLAAPRDIPILAPLAEREILYRLLLGDQTSKLRQIAFVESKLQQARRRCDDHCGLGFIYPAPLKPKIPPWLSDSRRPQPSTGEPRFPVPSNARPVAPLVSATQSG
jgi:AraC-type transcriptional regulator N-terminus